jgi:phage antirepressor YoqD-like protein
MQKRFGSDFSGVRVHADSDAVQMNRELNAEAFTHGRDIYFGAGRYSPETSSGKKLLAHELTHVVQQGNGRQRRGRGFIYRKTKGEETATKARNWLELEAKLKKEVDVLKVAIRDIKKGKVVEYNRKAGLKRLGNTGKLLGIKGKELKSLNTDWNWLVDNRKSKALKSYKSKEASFFSALQSPLKKLKKKFPGQQTHYWLKNSPAQVLEIIHKVADAKLPADELWAYAFKEGLVDYIRSEIGLAATDEPTGAQLKSVSVTKKISGFAYLGLDDFMTELSTKREPLSGFLPAGFDLTKVKEIKRINEKGREVKSGEFPNMLMAVQALTAMLKRRRKLFRDDAKTYGYTTPNREELVYWTYIYFNVGEFGGKQQLKKYKGKRKLSDWIKKGEYSNAIKLLQSYRMVKEMKLF